MSQVNNFETGLKYKLYSDVGKIIHPTISKKNISSYKIVLNDEIVPVRVFYPEKVSKLNKVIIYVHGISSVSGCSNKYSNICMNLAFKTKQLVIAIDYDESKRYLECLDDCYRCTKYLCYELEKVKINLSDITLVGDSIGASMILGINKLLDNEIGKIILISPVLSGNYFNNFPIDKNDKMNTELLNSLRDYYGFSLKYKKDYKDPYVFPLLAKNSVGCKALLIVGERDFLKEEVLNYSKIINSELLELPFVGHGFLNGMDLSIENLFYTRICEFLN